MANAINKEYRAFQANGYKEWSENKPTVEIVTADTSHWVSQNYTIEEAHQIISLINAAIVEAESAEDNDKSAWDNTPF